MIPPISNKLAQFFPGPGVQVETDFRGLLDRSVFERKEDLCDDWTLVPDSKQDTSCLIGYEMKDGRPILSFNPIFTEQAYQDLRELLELSYVLANSHTSKDAKKMDLLAARCTRIKETLIERGWDHRFSILFGATGADNQDPDASALISYNKKLKIIIIAFHGSRNGSKIPFIDTRGDWGSNYAYSGRSASELGINYLPQDTEIHEGIGKNFSSVQDDLWTCLEDLPNQMSEEELRGAWVFVTGHSKGGGMANIAAPTIKSFLAQHESPILKSLYVAAIPISSPRTFIGEDSQKRITEIIGKRNVVRINMSGDIVPLFLPRMMNGRSVGMLALDTKAAAERRLGCAEGIKDPSLRLIDQVAIYHYGFSGRGAGCEFTEALLPQDLKDLLRLLNQSAKDNPSACDGPSFYAFPENPSFRNR